jgi:peptidoglycan/LPS O-acetylase OafA/YrhL
LGNLAFLQEICVAPYGSNGPLWSLSYEFWYYMLLPCLALVCWRGVAARRRVLLGAVAATILLGVGPKIAVYFLIWLMGAAVAAGDGCQGRLRRPLTAFAGVAFAAGLAAARLRWLPGGLPADLAVGAPFALLVYAIVGETKAEAPSSYCRVSRFLADSSYTLYLLHVPALAFMRAALLNGPERWQPDLPHLAAAFALGLAVLPYVYLIARLTEGRTEAVRAFVARAFRRAPCAE